MAARPPNHSLGQQPHMAEEKRKAGLGGEAIREEQLELLFAQAPLAIIISPVASLALAIAIWDVVDHNRAITWVAVLTALALLRITVFAAYKARPTTFASESWEGLFNYTFLVAAFTWGLGAWLLLPDELAYRAIVFFFLMGMASAAVAVYAMQGSSVMLIIVALMLPTTVDFLLQESLQQQLMAVGVILYLVAANRSLRIANQFVERFQSVSFDLRRAKERAEVLARTDFLTGMNNRRSFYDLGKTPFKLARRHGLDLAVILLDIDRFKKINDIHGHAIGDEVLRKLALIVSQTCRESDVAGRVGGEEFAILLPHTDLDSAQELAERLRQQMEKAVIHLEQGEVKFTASFGVAQARASCESIEALVATADKAMYSAKQRGRNSVVVAGASKPRDVPLP